MNDFKTFLRSVLKAISLVPTYTDKEYQPNVTFNLSKGDCVHEDGQYFVNLIGAYIFMIEQPIQPNNQPQNVIGIVKAIT